MKVQVCTPHRCPNPGIPLKVLWTGERNSLPIIGGTVSIDAENYERVKDVNYDMLNDRATIIVDTQDPDGIYPEVVLDDAWWSSRG